MELVAYLHSELLCERLQQGESIDQHLDCQLLDLIAQSSRHAKSVLCVGLAASAIAVNAMPIAVFAYTPEIASIQQLLAKRGFNPGAIDGVKGAATTEAIIAAQIFYKLKADGVIGSQTLAALDGDTYESSVTLVPSDRTNDSANPTAKSDEVKNLQQLLTDRGFYGGAIDGIRGPMTKEAVILAQKTYGLIADGVAGSVTLAALEADKTDLTNTTTNQVTNTNVVQISSQEPISNSPAEVIKQAQTLMNNLGLYDGAIDGVQGSRTTAAIKQAQALYGLSVDGVLGSQTLAALQS